MIDIILYSRIGRDETLLRAIDQKIIPETAKLHAFCNDLKEWQIAKSLSAAAGEKSVEVNIYPWSHLVSWPFGILLETFRQYDRPGSVLMVEAEYFCSHPFDLHKFIDFADGYDLFTVGGRFERVGARVTMAFPSWEIALVSRKLLRKDDFSTFVFSKSQSPDPVKRLHIEREFAIEFMGKAKIGALVENADVDVFDPVASGHFKPADILGSVS